jgi:hypothetical protein
VRYAVAFCFAACAAAQTPLPSGLVRGDLLEWETAASGTGEFSIRTTGNQVYRFSFDSKTYFERSSERTTIDRLAKGDLLEVVSDKAPAGTVAYARTVHVVEREQPRRSLSAGRYRATRASSGWETADRSVLDDILPRGDLTFTGIVARVNADRLVLHTRRDGDKTLLVRQDTRFLDSGVQVDGSALKINTRVFVRGAKNFEGDLEAYQVVWGEILEPRP